MKVLNRRNVDRRSSSHQFANQLSRTKMANLHFGPRGGIRF